jgi:phosphatidylglycerophosphatase A
VTLTPIDRFALALATAGGAGFVPRLPGTIGSLVGVGLYLLILAAGMETVYIWIVLVIGAAGVWAAGRAESFYGHDASKIAIDEVAGQMLTLGFVTRSGAADVATGAILGFLLFRFFDILKPFPIRRLERLPGGLGVMADDVGAAAYALLLLLILEHQVTEFL